MSDVAVSVNPPLPTSSVPGSSSSEGSEGVQAILGDALGVKIDGEVEIKQVNPVQIKSNLQKAD